jgi:hypothetical protein
MLLCYPITWQDWFELMLITFFLYRIHFWLSQDRRTPLLALGYGYCCFLLISYYAPLPTMVHLIPIITPAMLVMIILLHKQTLQRDLIPYKNHDIQSNTNSGAEWLITVLRSALTTINDTQTVIVLFEYTDELAPFVQTPYVLHTPVHPELLALLLHRSIYQSNTMLWITHKGTIVSTKATWRLPTSYRIPDTIEAIEQLKDLAHIYSLKTNGLVCIIHQKTRTATLIAHGFLWDAITMQQAHAIIAKHLNISKQSIDSNKVYYEKPTSSSLHQRTP